MDGLDRDVADFFAAQGQLTGLTSVCGSRRVILHGLPPGITLGSVLEAVSANGDSENDTPGGLVSAQVFEDPTCPGPDKACCAMIEFVHPSAAMQYVHWVQNNEIQFQPMNHSGHRSQNLLSAYSASSLSNDLRPDTVYMLLAGQTRSLTIPICPAESVWEILCLIGTHLITRAQYHAENASLDLEFVSLFEADRAYGLLRSGQYPQLAICELAPPEFSQDSTQRSFDAIPKVLTLTDNFSPLAFDRAPFNVFCANFWMGWIPFYRLSTAHMICTRSGVLPCELMDWLDSRRNFKSKQFKVVGCSITLIRKAYTWEIDTESHIKLLISTRLDDPSLSEAWDDYFRLRGLPNLRRYEAYRAMATGESGSDQSESEAEAEFEMEDETADTSDTEKWSESRLEGAATSKIAPGTSVEAAPESCVRSTMNLTIASKPEKTYRPAEPKGANNNFFLTLDVSEDVVAAHGTSTDVNEPLLPDLSISEPLSWDLADYEDWLCEPQKLPHLSEASRDDDQFGHDHDLISFGTNTT
ncbi:hypothetical protein NLU13_0976 [Sarocladium strictum]|uniref:Uncharacterized protein n=1 Tax=Sarocladium strictum TaxID=5046 RepID=A0AA39LBX6_SARSR|nr:hypothetical protein NLU13_0976 [Sarocladium strictum]